MPATCARVRTCARVHVRRVEWVSSSSTTSAMAAANYLWGCVTPTVPFSPRDGAQLAAFAGKLFLLGGWNQYAGGRDDLAGEGEGRFESEVCSEVWSSADGGVNWELATVAPWSPRHMHGAVVHKGYLWVIGAENPAPDDVWRTSDPDGVAWECVAPSVPWPARANMLVTVFDDSIWVMGGQTAAPGQTEFTAALKTGKPFPPAPPLLKDVWRTSDGETWELVCDDAPWAPRGMISGANGGVPGECQLAKRRRAIFVMTSNLANLHAEKKQRVCR
jgi:hypothetical protein